MRLDHKKCSMCNVSKSRALFHKDKRLKSGLTAACAECRNEKSREYSKRHYLVNKEYHSEKNKRNRDKTRDLIRQTKMDAKCVDCMVDYHYSQLQFDHCLDDKKFNVTSAPGQFGKDVVADEMGKCEIVCVNCHEKRTWARKQENKSRRNYIVGRVKWLYELKESMPCLDCNRHYLYYQMQFDHVIGNKLFCVNSFSVCRKTQEEILFELMKCELVCGNCHSYRTHRRRGAA